MNGQQELDDMIISPEDVHSALGECPDFYGELKEAGWNVLHENPGCDFDRWQTTLVRQYPCEIVDAFGIAEDYYFQLEYFWNSARYLDDRTGENHTLAEWSLCFANDLSTEVYDMLAEARAKIKHSDAFSRQR